MSIDDHPNAGRKVGSPLFLIWSTADCERCKSNEPVVALASYNVEIDPGETFLLSDISRMPDPLLSMLTRLHPALKLKSVFGQKYYLNTCSKCDTAFEDFYLHNEPGGAFDPEDASDARKMTVEKLPIQGEFSIRASFGSGAGDLIFQYANRKG